MPAELLLAALVAGQLLDGGTQPNELRRPPEPSSACASCHQDYARGSVIEPGQSYAPTAMALSARDPFFRAAYVVAKRDRPDLAPLCIRCHAPAGWLSGRDTLGALVEDDLTGIGCDVCHRLELEDPPLIGDARLTLSESTAKRSRRGAAPFGGHGVLQTDELLRSEACGVCHSLFNPDEEAHDHEGTPLGSRYYEQRTYEEWASSVFPERNEGCVDCHLSEVAGAAVDGGEVHADLRVHDMVGANDLVARAVHLLDPTLGLGPLLPTVERMVTAKLQDAVELEVLGATPLVATRGEPLALSVRVTNRTGHKLPTGYPEGRRVYLELAWVEGEEAEVVVGRWDPATGDLVSHPQLVTYETVHGRVENGRSEVTHHLLLMNQILVDSRIPPEGFDPPFADMRPVGRDFGAAPPYRHWDEPRFSLPLPDEAGSELRLRVRALYQVAAGYAVDFLLEETAGTPEGAALAEVWPRLDRGPPREMARVEVGVRIEAAPVVPDAGVDRPDAPAPSAPPPPPGGCRGVGVRPVGSTSAAGLLLIALAFGASRSAPARRAGSPREGLRSSTRLRRGPGT